MAADKFTRGPTAGRGIPVSGGEEPPDEFSVDELPDILGELADAISVVEVTCRALEGAQEETPESVTPYAVSLRQGIALVNKAYERFDLALVALRDDDEEEEGEEEEGEEEEGEEEERAPQEEPDSRAGKVTSLNGHSAPDAGQRTEATDSGDSALSQALETERFRLFRAAAIIEACRFGSDSMLAHPDGRRPDFNFAFLAAYELISECAEQLETIAEGGEEQD